MMETEQGGSGSRRHISAQSAKEFLATIWLELLDWGTIALNSAGRFLTAMLNLVLLAIAATIAVFAVVVLFRGNRSQNRQMTRRFHLLAPRFS